MKVWRGWQIGSLTRGRRPPRRYPRPVIRHDSLATLGGLKAEHSSGILRHHEFRQRPGHVPRPDRAEQPSGPDSRWSGRGSLAISTHIPFENLDVLLGRPIRLDIESLVKKLVLGRRRVFLEQNLLFSHDAGKAGFPGDEARRAGSFSRRGLAPRAHMLLRVDIEDEPWLVDVGFGGSRPLSASNFVPGREQRQFLWNYRLVRESNTWVLQSERSGAWEDFYSFTMEPQEAVDYEVANYYVSTHPDSPFTARSRPSCRRPRHLLRNRELIVERAAGVENTTVADAELPGVLHRLFGLTLPPGATIPDRPWGWRG